MVFVEIVVEKVVEAVQSSLATLQWNGCVDDVSR